MRRTIFLLIFVLLASSCGVTHKVARAAGIYEDAYLNKDTGEKQLSGGFLILKKDGNFIALNTAAGKIFRGNWTFTGPRQIVLKCVPEPPKVDLATAMEVGYITPPHNLELEPLNKNTMRVNESDVLTYERVKYK